MLAEPLVPEQTPEPVVEVPQAAVVFDAGMAELWLRDSSARRQGVFASLRFEPDGMPEKHIDFLLLLAAGSIRKAPPGVLYVPARLAKSRGLAGMVKGERVGKYVAFRCS